MRPSYELSLNGKQDHSPADNSKVIKKKVGAKVFGDKQTVSGVELA